LKKLIFTYSIIHFVVKLDNINLRGYISFIGNIVFDVKFEIVCFVSNFLVLFGNDYFVTKKLSFFPDTLKHFGKVD